MRCPRRWSSRWCRCAKRRLADAYAQGAIAWRGEQVPLHFLPALLGDSNVAPVTLQYSPVLMLNSGDKRVALQVDEVVGNREVVVKNIGPQLARMPGIAGATVLGIGRHRADPRSGGRWAAAPVDGRTPAPARTGAAGAARRSPS